MHLSYKEWGNYCILNLYKLVCILMRTSLTALLLASIADLN